MHALLLMGIIPFLLLLIVLGSAGALLIASLFLEFPFLFAVAAIVGVTYHLLGKLNKDVGTTCEQI